ncbi:hypothetical protein HG535_0H02620 [Zygotorulaspora mrakii]|uniref:MBA1-like protein n=1 Tax=Zygotorulaspora mrakii TaxID=42260 RepID=A0A7H9B8C9_ZYGMR|nr:uncharacterized protein HG535_0H02620 [Zygotorulaspora mrakii]QLG74935.1 hypothetical protein HG535_0H02620 [Zygotorulaspora mrakii]
MLQLYRVGNVTGFLTSLKSLTNARYFSGSRLMFEESKKKDSKRSASEFNPRHLGVASEVYIPTSFKNLPSFWSHPLVFCNSFIRRIYVFGLNTVQVGIFRYQSGLKPNFLLWKNRAIENYVSVNTAFAQRKVEDVKSLVSIWVEEALDARSRHLPKYIRLDWELLKFNQIPKLVSVQAMMIPGRPLENIQLVYKFDTSQRLIKYNKKTSKAEKLDRNVVDYVAFLCDATTNELTLIGSLFESKPGAKLPKNYEDNTQIAIKRMRESGDLFRLPPV